MKRYCVGAVILSAMAICLSGIPVAVAQENDSLVIVDVSVFSGETVTVPIYLRNSEFLVSGFTLRLELETSNYVHIVIADRGQDISDFEYFYASFDSMTCRMTAVVNIPGGGDPLPLEIGRHEIGLVTLAVSDDTPDGFSDSLYFRSDTLPPDRDNSISDNSGYINLVPVLCGGLIEVLAPTGTGDESAIIPDEAALFQNYPNPFNAQTRLSFRLAADGSDIALFIFDMLGREIRRFEWDMLPAGRHDVIWHGGDDSGKQMASGVYFYRLTGSEFGTPIMKMTLLK